jgi:tight adherence protein B
MTPAIVLSVGVGAAVLLLVGGIGAALLLLGGDKARRRRLQRAAGHQPLQPAMTGRAASLRRDEVTGPFRNLELLLRRGLPGRDRLRARLARTGTRMSLGGYLGICAGVGAALFLLLVLMLGPGRWPFALVLAGAAGLIGPYVAIGILGGRRVRRFLLELPDAIDVCVRGLRSGLPVTETIATVAKDFDGPVGQEFKTIDDSVRLGVTLEDALWETARRIDVPEFNFLAISVGVQRETGGNLTETLSNLTALLRRRQQMRLKIRALSSEARASAYILGALPFLMAGLLYAMNPDYMSKLFDTEFGHVLLGAAALTEAMGVAVMWKMVRFEV